LSSFLYINFIYNISIIIDMSDFLFKAMGEDSKCLILKSLLNGEICACKIPSKIKRTQSNTSMHLAKLLEWHLIKPRREGKWIFYSIRDKRVYDAFKLYKGDSSETRRDKKCC
jgi:ArsR family transcriptional regulator, lead/cadmium/zinc/bismuth-responsive transcriptional repressor